MKLVQVKPDQETLRQTVTTAFHVENEAYHQWRTTEDSIDSTLHERRTTEAKYKAAVEVRQAAEQALKEHDLPECLYCPSKLETEQEQRNGLCKWCQL